jgi:hypothetical protein
LSPSSCVDAIADGRPALLPIQDLYLLRVGYINQAAPDFTLYHLPACGVGSAQR